jgi:hypothetical protein
LKTLQYETSYSSKRIITLIKPLFVVVILLIIAWLAGVFISDSFNVLNKLVFVLVAYSILGYFIHLFHLDRIDEIIDNFLGRRGEDEVAKILETNFNDSYTYIRNFLVPGHKSGDIDGLLISSNQITVIEVKKWTGTYRVIRGKFFRIRGRKKFEYKKNPIDQVAKQKVFLADYLKKGGFDLHISAVIVMVSGKIEYIEDPHVYVTNKDNLISTVSGRRASTDVDQNVNLPGQITNFLMSSRKTEF